MKKIIKISFLFLMIIISLNVAFALDWERKEYPEYEPYTNGSYYCESDIFGNVWLTIIKSKETIDVACFDGEKWIEYSPRVENFPKDSTISDFVVRNNGRVVFGGEKQLYLQQIDSSWLSLDLPAIGKHNIKNFSIKLYDIFEDKDNNIWVLRRLMFNGIEVPHISKYNGANWKVWNPNLPLYNYIGENTNEFNLYGNYRAIKQSNDGNIWLVGNNGFSTDTTIVVGGGIARYDGNNWKFWKLENGTNYSTLNFRKFTIDKFNRLIIPHQQISGSPLVDGGVSIFEDGKFTHYRQDNGLIPHDTTLGLTGIKFENIVLNERLSFNDAVSNNSSIYFNTSLHGIIEYDGKNWKSIANLNNGLLEGANGGYGICFDKNGDLWATNGGWGINPITRLTKKITSVEDNNFNNHSNNNPKKNDLNLQITPIPANDFINIDLKSNKTNINQFQTIKELIITDVSGLKIMNLKNVNTNVVDISVLTSGIYYLTLNINDQIFNEKIIVKK